MTVRILKRKLRVTLNKRELDTIRRVQELADAIRSQSHDLMDADEADTLLQEDWCTVDVGCSEVIQAGNMIEYPISA